MRTFFPRPVAWPRGVLGLFLVLVILGAAGCGDGKRYGTVSGQVLRKGKPVTGWFVVIDRRETGISTQMEPDDQGRFAFTVPLEVGTYSLSMGPILGGHPQDDPALMKKLIKQQATSVAKKYLDPKTSGWTVDVHEGKNEVLLEMTD